MENAIKQKLGDGYEVKKISVTKNNGVVQNGYCITEKGTKIGVTIYTDNVPEDEVVDHVVNGFNKHKGEGPNESLIKNILNPDFVKDNVFPVLVNHDKNEDRLDTLIHRDFLGLEIVYRLMVGEHSTILIEDKFAEHVGLSEEEIYNYAMTNIDKFAKSFRPFDGAPMIVVSLYDKTLGSGAIFSKKVISEISDELNGDDFFLIPSSVHEWIAFPVIDDISFNEQKSHLTKTLNKVNVTLDDPDFLSDTLYIYRNGKMEVA